MGKLKIHYYDENGPTSQDKAYCWKKYTSKGSPTYSILTNNKGQFFNPWDVYGEHRKTFGTSLRGNPIWTEKPVTENIFTKYISFLETKQRRFLEDAEREAVYG